MSRFTYVFWIIKLWWKINMRGSSHLACFPLGFCIHFSSLRIQRRKGTWEVEDKANKTEALWRRMGKWSAVVAFKRAKSKKKRRYVNTTWRMRRSPLRQDWGGENRRMSYSIAGINAAMAPTWDYLCPITKWESNIPSLLPPFFVRSDFSS